jgi:peroxiredoxin
MSRERKAVQARTFASLSLSVAVAFSVACGAAQAPAQGLAAAPTGARPAEASIAVTEAMGSPHPGDSAPDFELSDQHGTKVKLSELRGAVVVLAFVTSWCPFSRAEQPYLAKLAEQYRGQNVKVMAVDIKESDEGYARYLDRVSMPIPVLRDRTGDVTLSYTPDRAQPAVKDRAAVLVTSNLVIDAQGRIRFFSMVDTANFDAELVFVRRAVDQLLQVPSESRG